MKRSEMTSAGRVRYLDWKDRHPELYISHIIIEGDGGVLPSQIDGNVYFEGTHTPPEFTVFGDLYVSVVAGLDLQLGKFTVHGTLCLIMKDAQPISLYGFEEIMEKFRDPLPSNITLVKRPQL